LQELSLAKKQEKEKNTETASEQAMGEKFDDSAVKVDISGDEPDVEGTPEETDPLKILEARVQQAEEAASQAHDRLLRASAEYDNFKKRAQRDVEEFRKFANESLIKALLPIVDNLERAVESSGNDKKSNKGIVEGVEMTLREIYKVLEQFNLKPLESEGKPFDPNFHQAVLQEETGDHPENTVMKEMQKGYILHDRLIRPAMVVVSKAISQEKECQD
jgi:molecular chaperone GrpE